MWGHVAFGMVWERKLCVLRFVSKVCHAWVYYNIISCLQCCYLCHSHFVLDLLDRRAPEERDRSIRRLEQDCTVRLQYGSPLSCLGF
jgi:hypothetical protein